MKRTTTHPGLPQDSHIGRLRPARRSLGIRARTVLTALLVGPLGVALVVLPGSPASGSTTAGQTTPWPGGRWQPDPADYGMTVESNVPVKMDDGATLIANIGYPSDPATGQRAQGSFPVLLTQDPYVAEQQPQSFYVTRGYINAVVQVRGTGNSTGPGGKEAVSDMFGPRQTKDGVALVHWAAQLPGSDGKVGLDGCSFLGIDQIFTAGALGPHSPLKEILPACASNGYETYIAGGIPSQIVGLFGAVSSAGLSGTTNAAVNDAYNKAREAQILAGGPQAYDGTYWQQRSTYPLIPKIVKDGIPALLWSGWYPTDGPGSLQEYAIFQNTYDHKAPFGPMSPDQKVTGRYQVVIGPWMHGQGLDDTIQLEWYDTWLKGEDTGITDTTTPMHLYELQADRWVNASTYPLTDDYTAYHLASGGSLSTSAPTTTGSLEMAWGQPTTSGTSLTFDAAPLTADELIAGPIAATIYARSSARNTELIATLFDVAPSGERTELATGDIVGSLRSVDQSLSWYDKNGLLVRPDHPFLTNQYAPAGSLQRYDIGLTPTLYSLSAGDHLELVLSTQPPASSCASLLSALTTPLPCLPTAPEKQTLAGGVYHVQWSASEPSSVNVPLLPEGALPVTTSATTPTSNGLTEPLVWSGPGS